MLHRQNGDRTRRNEKNVKKKSCFFAELSNNVVFLQNLTNNANGTNTINTPFSYEERYMLHKGVKPLRRQGEHSPRWQVTGSLAHSRAADALAAGTAGMGCRRQ